MIGKIYAGKKYGTPNEDGSHLTGWPLYSFKE
jgi:hypothetical protein